MAYYVPPALVLSLTIAGMYGAVSHLLWGCTILGLLRTLGIAVVGFLVGEGAARLAGISFLMVGDVHLGIASTAAWAALAVDYWQNRPS